MTKSLAIRSILAPLLVFASLIPSSSFAKGGSYYVEGSLGLTGVNYSRNPGLQSFVDSQNVNASMRLPYNLELGFLFALSEQTALGVVYNGVTDYFVQRNSSQTGTVGQLNLALSARHFIGPEIGHGVFLRSDLGYGYIRATGDLFSSNAVASASGLYALAGGGFGLGMSEHTSLVLEADYGRIFLSSGGIGDLQGKVGILAYF